MVAEVAEDPARSTLATPLGMEASEAGYGGVNLLTGQTGGNGYINDRQQWPGGAGGGMEVTASPEVTPISLNNWKLAYHLEVVAAEVGASGGTGGIILMLAPEMVALTADRAQVQASP